MNRLAPLVLFGCVACTSDTSDTCDASSLDEATISASIDGDAWASTVTWVRSGDSVQFNTEASGGWRLTLVAQQTADGTTAGAALDDGALPAEFDFAADGGWALVYPDDQPSARSVAGTLTLTDAADSGVEACFSFDTDAANVVAGALRAAPF